MPCGRLNNGSIAPPPGPTGLSMCVARRRSSITRQVKGFTHAHAGPIRGQTHTGPVYCPPDGRLSLSGEHALRPGRPVRLHHPKPLKRQMAVVLPEEAEKAFVVFV